MTDTRPPVAPVEGHYAMLRNGVLDLIERHEQGLHRSIFDFKSVNLDYKWFETGKSIWEDPQYDIIATISPEAMALAIHPDMDGAVKAIENLVKLADAACDYADAHCRWFDISTAPKDGTLIQMVVANGDFPTDDNDELGHITIGSWKEEADESNEPDWDFVGWHWAHDFWTRGTGLPTHWRPLPPPPTSPPLPTVFTELGAALEKIKGAG